jgi:uncharacterized membrane protein
MVKKRMIKKSSEDSKLHAFLTVLLSILGFILALLLWKNDAYVKYYAKHSLILFIGFIIASVVGWIPVVGALIWIFIIVMWVITWLYALQGKKDVWLVSELAEKLEL